MAKDTYYFSHDFNARQDSKIKRLVMKHGMSGYGIFWSIVEDLYNNANALPTDYDSIAYDLRSTKEIVDSIIKDFGLFVVDGDVFGSMSVQKRLDERALKSSKARDAADKRWGNDANALPTHSDSNAIKEKKVKEKKVKKTIDSDVIAFRNSLAPFVSIYGKDMVRSFYEYWTEPNKSRSKLRFQIEKTWSLEHRIKRWSSNDNRFTKSSEIKPISISTPKLL